MLRRRVADPRAFRPSPLPPPLLLSSSNGIHTRSSCGGSHCFPCCCCSGGLLSATPVLRYMYQPPGTSSNETRRLPWYHRTTPMSATSSSQTTATVPAAVPRETPQTSASSPLHLQNLSSILQSATAGVAPLPSSPVAAAVPATARAASSSLADPSTFSSPQHSSGSSNTPRIVDSTAATAATSTSSTSRAPGAAPAIPSHALAAAVAATSQAALHVAALRCGGDGGVLRLTPARRMSAITGPTLDARVEDIIKVEETLASELTLPKVVQLLIDPAADSVERITMSEFAAMQPKRQLLALNGNKEWLQWIEQSTYYQQAARLAAESPAQDLAALQQAGIHSLQQWLEHPQLVKVSARTRSALDTAVAQSVEAYMAEVVQVVNTSNAVEEVLVHWVADVMGKFVLDSLQVPLDRASQAMWTARKEWMPADVVRNGTSSTSTPAATGASSVSTSRGADVTGGGAPQSVESRMLSEMLSSAGLGSGSSGPPGSPTPAPQRPMLRAGEACTLDHYLRFAQKVVSSVRKDYVANHAAMGRSAGSRGDEQAEQEIMERSYGVIAAALTQVLEQAVLHQLPPELATLQQNGYLALDRVPGLLKRAGNLLQLRAVPVRFFVFHSSVDEAAASAAAAAAAARGGNAGVGGGGGSAMRPDTAGLSLAAPPHYPPGTFLVGSNQLDVPLGEWSGRPDPPSSTARESGGVVDDATEQEYLSVLRRLRRRVDTLAVTSLYEVIAQPERYGGNGFSAVEAIGLRQLFGPVKLLEDRLTTALHYPVAAADKPIHFVEAGPLSGKTALLEQLTERAARPGDKVVLVRYGGSATPYLPDLDDHPVAFAARFWFRVALASCPYLIHTEELYSRAPRSVYWWGHEKNWSWERYQSLLQSARNAGAGHRQHQQQQQQRSAAAFVPAQLSSILVDDVDRALVAMQLKWGGAASQLGPGGVLGNGGVSSGMTPALTAGSSSSPAAAAQAAARQADGDVDDEEDESGEGSSSKGSRSSASLIAAAVPAAALSQEQQRQQVLSLWLATGKSVEEHLSSCFTQLSAAVGQVNIVFAGTAVTPLLLTHCAAPCRRYYLPLSGGVGLQSRLRVLPLLATLHAMHLSHHLDMPGLLYEVLKNCPALAGKALELFWSNRVSTMDLRTGLPRLTMGSGSAHPQLMQSYVPRELFAELPLYTNLLQNPRRTRRRLVELLQRQLSSPTGYLSTELDTTPQDVKDGLVLPHNLTSSQVHPFALFAIFSRQDAIDERVFNSEGQLLDGSEVAANEDDAHSEGTDSGEADSAQAAAGKATGRSSSTGDAAAAARVRRSTGVSSNERKVVRAWAEVWAEYRSVVSALSTSPTRKRDAMRILLHGALLLRSAAVAGAQLELNLKVPSYGFPLLASETRVRSSSSSSSSHAHQRGDSLVRPATPDTVRRATAAYKMFFSSAAPSHFPFRPMVGLNGGCDVVFVCGSTLALYDIVTTTAQLRQVVGRFAEALLGVLHVLERQVFPVDKVRAVQFVTVVSLDEPRPGVTDLNSSSSGSNVTAGGGFVGSGYGSRRGGSGVPYSSLSGVPTPGGVSVDVFNSVAGAAATVPYFLDYDAIFDDHVMDRLRELQQSLGITRDFRTLNELIDEIACAHRVRVTQDVVSTPEEVESLFSPTLLQLVPDATVLPPYTSAVVSAAELMMQAMKQGGGGAAAKVGTTGAGAAAATDSLNLSLDDDDDDDADYINLGEEEVTPGAELDDVASDVRLSREGSRGDGKNKLFAADDEHLHESAELLEAIMNDNLDMMSNSSARLQEQREQTAQELRRDLVMEDRINYNAPAPSTTAAGTATGLFSAVLSHGTPVQHQQQQHGVPTQRRNSGSNAGRTAAEDAEADALAWLHDIITPESLIAGLKGTAPGAGTPLASTVSSSNPPLSGGGVGSTTPALSIQLQQQQQQQYAAPLTTAGAASPMMPSVTGPWTPNIAAPDVMGSISAVFPPTAAKRDESGSISGISANTTNSNAAAAAGVVSANAQQGSDAVEGGDGNDDEEELASPEKDVEADEERAEEMKLQKLFDEVGSRRRRGDATSAAAAGSHRQRRGSGSSVGRLTEEGKTRRGSPSSSNGGSSSGGQRKSKVPTVAKGRKSSSSASSSAGKKRGKTASSSPGGGKKKSSSSKKR